MVAQGSPMLASRERRGVRNACATAQGERQPSRPLHEEHPLPHQFLGDVFTVAVAIALVAGFVVLAQAYGQVQPMLLLAMPIPLAAALIVLIVAHDRRVAGIS